MLLSSITILHLFVCAPAKSISSVPEVATSPKLGTREKPESITLAAEQFANVVVKNETDCCSMCTKDSECKMWRLSPHANAGSFFCKLYKSECTEMSVTPKLAQHECAEPVVTKTERVVGRLWLSVRTTSDADCCRLCAENPRCQFWNWVAPVSVDEVPRCNMLRYNKCRKMIAHAAANTGTCADVGHDHLQCKYIDKQSRTLRDPDCCVYTREQPLCSAGYTYSEGPKGCPYRRGGPEEPIDRSKLVATCCKPDDTPTDTEVEMLLVSKKVVTSELPNKAACGKSCSDNPGCEAWKWLDEKIFGAHCVMHGHTCTKIEGNYKARMETFCTTPAVLESETEIVLVKDVYEMVNTKDRTTCCDECFRRTLCNIWMWQPLPAMWQPQQTGTGGACYMYKSCNKYSKVTGHGKVPSNVPKQKSRRRRSAPRHSTRSASPLKSISSPVRMIPVTQKLPRKLRGSYSQ